MAFRFKTPCVYCFFFFLYRFFFFFIETMHLSASCPFLTHYDHQVPVDESKNGCFLQLWEIILSICNQQLNI